MLNPFPDLLFLGILAPTILRIVAGLFFLHIALAHYQGRQTLQENMSFLGSFRIPYSWSIVLVEAAVGAALLTGFLTQIAALLGILGVIKGFLLNKRYPLVFPLSRSSYLLLGTILLVLVITGAGAFAFDLPL
jgi:uncharacterized membrane protein YphA (DoxX/SURF4 family)